MKKKMVCILLCMLLIATVIPAVGALNKNLAQEETRFSEFQNLEIRSLTRGVRSQSSMPNDEYFDKQWSLHNTGQTGGIPDADIDAPEAWNIETGDSDVVIAIIDTGIDYTHPDLADKIWNNKDEIPDNSIDDDGNGYIDDDMGWNFQSDDNYLLDWMGHGTVCAGVFGAVTNNNQGIAGVCWNCQIMPLKYGRNFGFPGFDIMIEAIKYAADNGADIITMSLGTFEYNKSFEDAVNYAYKKGVFICASAGNDGTSAKHYPAAFENVTAVAATNNEDGRMYYYDERLGLLLVSNYGDWVDVAAPGQEIYSTFPSYDCDFTTWGFAKNYDYLSGTSLAAPHVAGLAALLMSKNPSLSPDNLKAIICGNVDPYNSTYYLGTGRINAYKAIIASPPDLSCEGNLSWNDVKPRDTVTGNFTVENIGGNGTMLDWKVAYHPNWGSNWSFNPESGENLKPEDGTVTVQVTCVAPNKKGEFKGAIKVENLENPDFDNCFIEVSLTVQKNKAFNINFSPLSWMFERFPNAFPILRHLRRL